MKNDCVVVSLLNTQQMTDTASHAFTHAIAYTLQQTALFSTFTSISDFQYSN